MKTVKKKQKNYATKRTQTYKSHITKKKHIINNTMIKYFLKLYVTVQITYNNWKQNKMYIIVTTESQKQYIPHIKLKTEQNNGNNRKPKPIYTTHNNWKQMRYKITM